MPSTPESSQERRTTCCVSPTSGVRHHRVERRGESPRPGSPGRGPRNTRGAPAAAIALAVVLDRELPVARERVLRRDGRPSACRARTGRSGSARSRSSSAKAAGRPRSSRRRDRRGPFTCRRRSPSVERSKPSGMCAAALQRAVEAVGPAVIAADEPRLVARGLRRRSASRGAGTR